MERHFRSKKTAILIFGFACIILLVSSCKKDSAVVDNDTYYMRFKANGVQFQFTEQASLVATFAQTGTIFTSSFTGLDGLSQIVLFVYDNKEIAVKTYSGYFLVGSSFIGALISYNDPSGNFYKEGIGNSDGTVTISEMTDKTVRGSFGGTVVANGKADIKITNGEFFLWRAN